MFSNSIRNFPARRFAKFARSLSDIGFCFDIDGVLLKGKKAIPGAANTLRYLQSEKVPFVLFTNGGGVSEESRSHFISKTLGVDISPRQIILSHTPFRALAQDERLNRVLVVGGPGDSARHVAQEYGFREVLMPIDVLAANESIWPFHRYSKAEIANLAIPVDSSHIYGPSAKPFDCILIFNDPRDMGADIQIVADLLNSHGGYMGTKRHDKGEVPSVPILFSNNDFFWANDYPQPRFGQGAFKIAVDAIYNKINGTEKMQSMVFGKPEKVSYDYAHHVLIDWRNWLGGKREPASAPVLGRTPERSPFREIYMIGDNPASDIEGGNRAHWNTVLVRTGVFQDHDLVHDTENLIARPSHGVFDNVEAAVRGVLEDVNN
ncbi:hypothetical protein PP7435_CHR1-0073 [Komagataella phaffii CBS 7435]|uniref:HAD-superfamily hydrolase n=2 Tax=Komagataella phaffii TaxID=460519 RepID=C4QV60_KOMPG|nr:uncharacterized protein PAS_chr1-3_0294 [Komagataella phaffii GS115]AOA61358.1 GQ67_02328T0 [Komagataella phaffii]CAH2445785.1 Hypothetical protein BQ9382_C1-0375 [Komagataella phaffii CBS 7435]AOA66221.1 GQ68_02919T0 [Komagataella phaffii GS115]CAY67133.1 hypothetical protein PAS_chr1-3_0294 [Komagataella phaffii GS115]CCA36241.1 hypothetical protein PP7435_CHR1-0073 [Komagataella phaffii CBS 7435]